MASSASFSGGRGFSNSGVNNTQLQSPSGLSSKEANEKFYGLYARLEADMKEAHPFKLLSTMLEEISTPSCVLLSLLCIGLFVVSLLTGQQAQLIEGCLVLVSIVLAVAVSVWQRYLGHTEALRVLNTRMRAAMRLSPLNQVGSPPVLLPYYHPLSVFPSHILSDLLSFLIET